MYKLSKNYLQLTTRLTALFLTLVLSLPNPTFALRPEAGLEEQNPEVKRQFLSALGVSPLMASSASSGLEEAGFTGVSKELQRELQEFGMPVGSVEVQEVVRRQGDRAAALRWFLEHEKRLKDLAYQSQLPLNHVLRIYLQERGRSSAVQGTLISQRAAIDRLIKQWEQDGSWAAALTQPDLLWILHQTGSAAEISKYLRVNEGQIRSIAKHFQLQPDQVFWVVRQEQGNFVRAYKRLERLMPGIEKAVLELREEHASDLDRTAFFRALQWNGDLVRAKRWLLQAQLPLERLGMRQGISVSEALPIYWSAEQASFRLQAKGVAVSREDILFLLSPTKGVESAVSEAEKLSPKIQAIAEQYGFPQSAVWWAYRQKGERGLEKFLRDIHAQAEEFLSSQPMPTAAGRLTFNDAVWLVIRGEGNPLIARGTWNRLRGYLHRLVERFRRSYNAEFTVADAMQWRRRSRTLQQTGRRIQWESPVAVELAQQYDVQVGDVLAAHERATAGNPRSLWDPQERRATEKVLRQKVREAKRSGRELAVVSGKGRLAFSTGLEEAVNGNVVGAEGNIPYSIYPDSSTIGSALAHRISEGLDKAQKADRQRPYLVSLPRGVTFAATIRSLVALRGKDPGRWKWLQLVVINDYVDPQTGRNVNGDNSESATREILEMFRPVEGENPVIQPDQVWIPKVGGVTHLMEKIHRAGGIDLMLVGVGPEGSVGHNFPPEPGFQGDTLAKPFNHDEARPIRERYKQYSEKAKRWGLGIGFTLADLMAILSPNGEVAFVATGETKQDVVAKFARVRHSPERFNELPIHFLWNQSVIKKTHLYMDQTTGVHLLTAIFGTPVPEAGPSGMPSWLEKEDAASDLGWIGGQAARPAVKALIKALKDEDERAEVREQAAWALGRIGSGAANAVSALSKALHDNSERVRSNAAVSLGQIGGSEATHALANVLDPPHFDQEVRMSAAMGLSQVGPEVVEVFPRLLHALRDPSDRVRLAAVIALGKVVNNFPKNGGSPSEKRRRIIQAQRAMLRKMVDDPITHVRDAAKKALAQLNGSAGGLEEPSDEATARQVILDLKEGAPEKQDASVQKIRKWIVGPLQVSLPNPPQMDSARWFDSAGEIRNYLDRLPGVLDGVEQAYARFRLLVQQANQQQVQLLRYPKVKDVLNEWYQQVHKYPLINQMSGYVRRINELIRDSWGEMMESSASADPLRKNYFAERRSQQLALSNRRIGLDERTSLLGSEWPALMVMLLENSPSGLEERSFVTVGGLPVSLRGRVFHGYTTQWGGRSFVPRDRRLLSVLEPGRDRVVAVGHDLKKGSRLFVHPKIRELQPDVVRALGPGQIITLPQNAAQIPGFWMEWELQPGDAVLLDVPWGTESGWLPPGVSSQQLAIINLPSSVAASLTAFQLAGLEDVARRQGSPLRMTGIIKPDWIPSVFAVDLSA